MTAFRSGDRPARGLVPPGRVLWAAAWALAAVAAPASAQTAATTTPTGGAVKFGQPGQPIDITAKSTLVFQQERRVVYQGEVEAIQGTTRLRTPQLTLWYNNNNAVKTPGAPAPSAGPSGAIDRMDAEGPVYYVTATQSAKGDHGSYSAADDTITLVGNVILTQDKNVSTGDKLVIHQKDGTATLSSEKASGRVRGVFYNEDKGKPAAAAAVPPPKAR